MVEKIQLRISKFGKKPTESAVATAPAPKPSSRQTAPSKSSGKPAAVQTRRPEPAAVQTRRPEPSPESAPAAPRPKRRPEPAPAAPTIVDISRKPAVTVRSKPVAAVIAETPAPVAKTPREPRLRGRLDVKKFLPLVARRATLRTTRALDFLKNLEGRSYEERRLPKEQKFPMSVMEVKALNEAIKIMEIKLLLEQEDVERQKAEKNGSTKKG